MLEWIFQDPPFFLGAGELGCEVFADNLFVDPGEQFHTLHLGEVLKMAMICLSLIVARRDGLISCSPRLGVLSGEEIPSCHIRWVSSLQCCTYTSGQHLHQA